MNEEIKKLVNKIRDNGEEVVLDIGCGNNKKGNIGVDFIASEQVDFVMDINSRLDFDDASVDKIIMHHVLEHLDDPIKSMKECFRMLKPGGTVEIKLPHHSSCHAYEMSHKTYWGMLSFEPIKIRGKSNQGQALFTQEKMKLQLYYFNFLSIFFVKHKYFYELYACRIFPCYEMTVVFKK